MTDRGPNRGSLHGEVQTPSAFLRSILYRVVFIAKSCTFSRASEATV